MSILENLYYGNLDPVDKYVKPEGEYHRLTVEKTELVKMLRQQFSGEQKQLLEEIEDKTLEIYSMSEMECFIDGFRLGALLMLEVINYKSENFTDLTE